MNSPLWLIALEELEPSCAQLNRQALSKIDTQRLWLMVIGLLDYRVAITIILPFHLLNCSVSALRHGGLSQVSQANYGYNIHTRKRAHAGTHTHEKNCGQFGSSSELICISFEVRKETEAKSGEKLQRGGYMQRRTQTVRESDQALQSGESQCYTSGSFIMVTDPTFKGSTLLT